MIEEKGPDRDLEQDEVVVLTDEEGKEHEFSVIDILEVDGSEDAILLPADDDSDEAIILKIGVDENGEEILSDIEDDEEWEKVADKWQELIESEEEDDE